MLCFSPLVNHLRPLTTTAQFDGIKFKPKPSLRFGFLHTEIFISSSSLSTSSVGRVRSSASSSSWSSLLSADEDFDAELSRLLDLLPEEMQKTVRDHPELCQLIEVVLDLGRKPLARFPSGDYVLLDNPIRVQDLEYAVSQVGDFTIDNRAGISRTLHRISAIRNRKGDIIGLTCRVGRAVRGSANLLRDLVKDGASLLLIGPPGVGKTTLIREIARMLANDYKKRVMLVDTSNEIGGDGDIPHPGIGNARRMQVPDSNMQHKVMIEAVENHMPQVIVIDEIGTKLEAMAACTIAERGIQLVATAHGLTIENLIMNPSLDLLVGGVQSVTLGDEEAARRGGQKTVLERKGPPTFSCGVEIVSKTEVRVHRSLEATVDAVLSGRLPNIAIRKMNCQGVEEIAEMDPFIDMTLKKKDKMVMEDISRIIGERTDDNVLHFEFPLQPEADSSEYEMPLYLYVYGITEATVTQGIQQLAMDAAVQLTDNISEADALLGLQSKLKKNPGIQSMAKSHGMPIYVTKTSSVVQVTKAIRALLTDHEDGLKGFASEDGIKVSEKMDALQEARIAIEQVAIPKGEPVELLPRPSRVVSLQAKLVKKYHLQSERICKGAEICLLILPSSNSEKLDHEEEEHSEFDEFTCATRDSNGLLYTMDRLPLLPD